jgi:hypothetical protein
LYDECFADYSAYDRNLKLSKESENILNASSKQRKSSSVVAREIAERQKEYVARSTIDDYRHRAGLTPFHVIEKLLKTKTHISDRFCLCDWLKDWTQEECFVSCTG